MTVTVGYYCRSKVVRKGGGRSNIKSGLSTCERFTHVLNGRVGERMENK